MHLLCWRMLLGAWQLEPRTPRHRNTSCPLHNRYQGGRGHYEAEWPGEMMGMVTVRGVPKYYEGGCGH